MSSSNIRDNHDRGTVADFLRTEIEEGAKLSVVSAYFTVHAYQQLREPLDKIGSMRFLFGEPAFLDNLDSEHNQSKSFALTDSGLTLDQSLGGRANARACAAWIKHNNVEIRSVKRPDFLHGKLYFAELYDGKVQRAITGSSNFTVNGLGLKPRDDKGIAGNFELNMVVDGDNDKRDLLRWFDFLWDHPLVGPATEQVLAYLNEAYADRDPDFVYRKTLLHFFGEAAQREAQQDEETVQTLEDTAIWRALYQFQQHGVKGIINRIAAHGGCVLADSVGLGKTFSALAVIKYFEIKATQKSRVLVLCPKKLEENWRVYLDGANSKYNPFPDDGFSYTLLAHTDLTRESGINNGVDLANVRWDNYDLVVIDESHNLRNRKSAKYEKLMQEVVKGGKGTKFLLLSATPVNVDLSDLHNQIALFSGDDEGAFRESLGIRNLKTTIKDSQKAFVKWSVLPPAQRTANALALELPPAFFHLLDGISIARSRKQIQTHYADSLAEIGASPTRLAPDYVHSEVDLKGHFLSYARLDAELSNYSLCVFKPSTYVLPQFKDRYADTTGIANFSQETRERYLIDMMKINFLKRLESSVFSFGETMNRTIKRIDTLIDKLKHFETLEVKTELGEFDPDEADPELEAALQTGKAVKYKLEHLRRADYIEDLESDREKLLILANAAAAVTPARDAKLAELKAQIVAKVNAGDTDRDDNPDRKILVFTAFADTAHYLYKELKDWAKTSLNMEVGLVTGASGGVDSTLGARNFAEVLAHFSPVSKQRAPLPKTVISNGGNNGQGTAGSAFGLFGDGAGHGADAFGLLGAVPALEEIAREPQIDLLIATDCISEGQNLQDCGTLINFDVHWNPVRLVQRFGRIDRIGSRHKNIKMINFWPTATLDEYINLKSRVESRMALAVLAGNGDDNLLEGAKSEIGYRDQQLLRLQNEQVPDLEEIGESVTFSDFTLQEFRLDLQEFLDQNRQKLLDAPIGIFAVAGAGAGGDVRPGFLFCLRRKTETTSAHYPYAPHYIVYVSRDGAAVHAGYMNLKSALGVWKATSLGQLKNTQLCQQFDLTIDDGRDMSAVVAALQTGVADIAGVAGKMSLKQALAGAKMDAPVAASLGDFELVTWLAIV